MTYPLTQPRFAPAEAQALNLTVIRAEDWPALSETHPQRDWLRASGFEAGLGELRLLPGPGGILGAVAGLGSAQARRRQRFGLAKAIAALPEGAWTLQGDLTPAEREEAVLAWLLQGYRFDCYRAKGRAGALLVAPEGVDAARLLAMAEGEYLTRDLVNTPAQDMGPAQLQAAFADLAARHGASFQAVVGDDLLPGYPMVHAVGRAAAPDRAPRIMELRWGAEGPALTLVGKGVCFDTGGLNIKPSNGMQLMKKDMGGAATVMGLAHMIMTLGLKIRLRVIVPSVENAISGNALRPKDILTSRKGLTVEVNDTDAEGRLILGDALAWACEEESDLLVSMATLTGAARVAVGPDLAPYYTDDAAVMAALEAGAVKGFDPVWRLPFHDAYESVIEPGIADLDNAPGYGFAGSVTAALFLRRFTDQRPYLHFDLYAHSPSDLPARPKGAVGQGARAVLGAVQGLWGV
ncbi:leucyl aminopeptidase family protein [Stagnihabitans tardus]|uniref:Leucyl aminopeptidase family protein n=1 Tax=Stagnihabitans tardus TaxID=2699202 RepID=A0AAE5BWA3_9RHOB|nr:leucyl aminopeptidase family protein [Stagnihabitans tardus]NBZ88098.1 leucyl aminopeptidase family protein [Stagnihabitans tardus]